VDYLYWRWLEFSDPAATKDAAPEYVPDDEEEEEEEFVKPGARRSRSNA
jgi:hypothetical protein